RTGSTDAAHCGSVFLDLAERDRHDELLGAALHEELDTLAGPRAHELDELFPRLDALAVRLEDAIADLEPGLVGCKSRLDCGNEGRHYGARPKADAGEQRAGRRELGLAARDVELHGAHVAVGRAN